MKKRKGTNWKIKNVEAEKFVCLPTDLVPSELKCLLNSGSFKVALWLARQTLKVTS